jgi:Xaa-Pro aminopeptidase
VSLIEQARTGDAAFAPAAADAERLVAAAGAAQSESWIAAQQALSAAIAARKPTAVALADVDTLAAKALQTQGGVAPNDLKAIDGAAAEVSGISIHQTDRIAAMQHRLGL